MIGFDAKRMKIVAKRFGLELVYVFGSMARGDAHASSDIDVAFFAAQPFDAKQRMNFSLALRSVIDTQDRSIDLVDLRHAAPLLAHQVMTEGIKLFGSSVKDDRMYRLSIKRYIDAKKIFQADRDYVRKHARV